jgi:hypothetical protein
LNQEEEFPMGIKSVYKTGNRVVNDPESL